MSNFLEDGTVLPSGLMDHSESASMAGFNKTYRNTALRMGVVIATYPVTDPKNRTKLATEYDVSCIEQNEDRGATSIQYKNCMSLSGLGSIADFFEKTYRQRKVKDYKGDATRLQNQDGSIVMLLCLDGASDKAIIVGGFSHPDRKTTLTTSDPRLEGEYNGINVKVETDGSTTLTFRGATDNQGKPIDASQGDTVLSIEKDGSFQAKHKTITQRLDKSGKASLTADDEISNTTKTNFSVTATKDINLTATGDLNAQCKQLAINASGSASLQAQSLMVQAKSSIEFQGSMIKMEAESMASIKGSMIVLDGLTFVGGQGGVPVLLMNTIMFGIGNLGLPVISQAIAGFSLKTFAT